MTWRRIAKSCVVLVALGALVLAAEYPLGTRQDEARKKYAGKLPPIMAAKRVITKEEAKLADAVILAREQYKRSLASLREFYAGKAYFDGLRRVEAEIEHLNRARKYHYILWEELLPTLSATTPDPAADKLLKEADALRKSLNPFNREWRLWQAREKYRAILQKHPNSTAVDSAAFGLGEVYSCGAVGEYKRALTFYDLCYLSNPNTKHEPLFRAAQVLDEDRVEYGKAAEYYWLTIKHGRSKLVRHRASMRLKSLQKMGFGTEFKKEEETPEAEALSTEEE